MSNNIQNKMGKQKWSRLVLFRAVEHTTPILLWGEPIDPSIDVGYALAQQPPQEVKARVWVMNNPEDIGAHPTEEVLTIKTLFCPVDTKRPRDSRDSDHALPTKIHNVTINKTTDPACYITRQTSQIDNQLVHGPQLQRLSSRQLTLPDISQCPDCITFSPAIKDEEEMIFMLRFTILMGNGEGPITKENAIDYVAGYTLAVSSAVRIAGDKSDLGPVYHGIDAFCPFGPVLVSPSQMPNPAEMSVTVVINGKEQEIQAQGATLEAVQSSVKFSTNAGYSPGGGGLVMNGTPAGLLGKKEPAFKLRKGDMLKERVPPAKIE